MKMFIILLSVILVPAASAQSWQCRNQLEIRCADGKCRAEGRDGFTPMSVSFSESGDMSVCAYSGCWEGRGRTSRFGEFLSLAGNDLPFSTSSDPAKMRQSISIIFDRTDSVAILKAGEFAHPLMCKKETPARTGTVSFIF